MPLYYKTGMLEEHIHTRKEAGLFDVSHMGQLLITSPQGTNKILELLEKLVPSPLSSLKSGSCRYTVLTNENGGCIDDLLIEVLSEKEVLAVLNASRKHIDLSHLKKMLPELTFELINHKSLFALQGPKAVSILNNLIPGVDTLKFMHGSFFMWQESTLWITRSGYTGEDGFEISLPNALAETFAKKLLAHKEVALIGLGARDSLRLEAGLPLYGHELNLNRSFLEANMRWLVGKPIPEKLNCLGKEYLNRQLKDSSSIEEKRVGLIIKERSIPREGYKILNEKKVLIGIVTSGAYSPTLKKPIAQGYVKSTFAKIGTKVYVVIREKPVEAELVKLPFIAPGYAR